MYLPGGTVSITAVPEAELRAPGRRLGQPMSLVIPIVLLGLLASVSPSTIVVFILLLATTRARVNAAAFLIGGAGRDSRGLKHRAEGESRRVPCPPPLVRLLHEHLTRFGGQPDQLVFRGVQGSPLATITYRRAWDKARRSALTEHEYQSALARRPYDLRHACLSTWLNGGVAPTQVAEWAGHSVEMLLRVYAKCLDGQDQIARRRIIAALNDSHHA